MGDLKSYLRKKCCNRRRLETTNEDSSSKRTGIRRGPRRGPGLKLSRVSNIVLKNLIPQDTTVFQNRI